MSEFFFKCHGCGKCCNTGPVLLFDELYNFVDDFAFFFQVAQTILPVTSSEARSSQFQYIKERGFFNLEQQDGFYFLFQCFPVAMTISSTKRCPQLLEDGKCGIYERKPEMCNIVPFDTSLPDELQNTSQTFLSFLKEGCLIEENKPEFIKIYEYSRIYSPYKESKEKFLQDLIKNKDLLLEFLGFLNNTIGFPLDQNVRIALNPSFYFQFLYLEKENLSKDDFKKIIESQNLLLRKLIDASLKIKNKDDRNNTLIMRNFLDQNIVMLKDL